MNSDNSANGSLVSIARQNLPDYFFIEITSACNMDCVFCPYGTITRQKKNMSHEMVMSILDEIDCLTKENRIPITFHCLGEPMLNSHFEEYLSFCDERRIPYWLVTNGTLFNEKKCDLLFSHSELDHVEVSFHTISERSLKIRNARNLTFSGYMNKIKEAVFNRHRHENGIPLQIDVMYDLNLENGKLFGGFDLDEWEEFSELMQEWGKLYEEKYPNIISDNPSFFKRKNRLVDLGTHLYCRGLDSIPKDFFSSQPDRICYITWEVVPKLTVSIKKFFIFTSDSKYLERINNGIPVQIKEKQDSFKCDNAKLLVVLSDGTITFCCLDDMGKLSVGKYGEDGVNITNALLSDKRQLLISNTEKFEYCRQCRGKKIFTMTK